MGRIILTPSGPRHPLEARAPAVRNEATVIILLAVHSSIYWKVTVSDPLGLQVVFWGGPASAAGRQIDLRF